MLPLEHRPVMNNVCLEFTPQNYYRLSVLQFELGGLSAGQAVKPLSQPAPARQARTFGLMAYLL
jgi:hypothetical protein